MISFKKYKDMDYQAVCDFLIELNNKDKQYINWNWARWEWMYEHPEFDKSVRNSIGLWWDNDRIVGAAIYDMYFGEAFCGVLPEYIDLYDEVLRYAYENLRDDSGIGIAINDDDKEKIEIAKQLGFNKAEQTEPIMKITLDEKKEYYLEDGLSIKEFDPAKNAAEFAWVLWQGFDHGEDREQFETEDEKIPQNRVHLKKQLSLAVENELGEKVAYCCLWYDEKTDYAYIEPVCTIPQYRGKGAAKAALFEAFNRAKDMGAKEAFVISDMDFYRKLGLKEDKHFTFYWKE